MVRRSGVERVKVDVGECAVAAEAVGQGGKVEGLDVGEIEFRAARGEEGFEAGFNDKRRSNARKVASPKPGRIVRRRCRRRGQTQKRRRISRSSGA